MTDMKLTDQVSRHEIDGHENDGHETGGQDIYRLKIDYIHHHHQFIWIKPNTNAKAM